MPATLFHNATTPMQVSCNHIDALAMCLTCQSPPVTVGASETMYMSVPSALPMSLNSDCRSIKNVAHFTTAYTLLPHKYGVEDCVKRQYLTMCTKVMIPRVVYVIVLTQPA